MGTLRQGLLGGTVLLVASATGATAYAQNNSSTAAKPVQTSKSVKIVTNSDTYAFKAKTIKVAVGTKVIWKNTTQAPHTITNQAHSKGHYDKSIDVGKTVSITFKKAGTYKYFCSIHPYMKGTIVVK